MMSSFIDQTKISASHYFLREMFVIAENSAVLYLKTPNFWWVLTRPQFLRYLKYKKNLRIGFFFLSKISQKLHTLLKIAGTDFYVIPSSSNMQKNRNKWLCPLCPLVKNLIFPYKIASFFAIQIAIISITKIWRHVKFSLVHQTKWK